MKRWRCINCDRIFFTYDDVTKHLNDIAVFQEYNTITITHTMEELN